MDTDFLEAIGVEKRSWIVQRRMRRQSGRIGALRHRPGQAPASRRCFALLLTCSFSGRVFRLPLGCVQVSGKKVPDSLVQSALGFFVIVLVFLINHGSAFRT